MPPTPRPLPTAITAGVHYQHVIDLFGTKLIACLLCPGDLVPFVVFRQDFPGHSSEESLFSAMYTKLLSHLYSVHVDVLRPDLLQNDAAKAMIEFADAAEAALLEFPELADDPDPDLESLLDDESKRMEAQRLSDAEIAAHDQSLHDAVFAVARKHSQHK